MPNTPVYTDGVKYIKIAKQDSGSLDNSVELQNLTDIRIKFSDIGNAVQYNVVSIAEYSTYYLYTIIPLNVTSSADQEILNYRVSASVTSKNYSNSPFTLSNYNNVASLDNPLGYFNSSSGEWTLNNTPNVYLSVTCSITFDWSPDSPPITRVSGSIFLYNLNNGTSFRLSPVPIVNTPGNTNNWIASGSFTPIEGDKYVVRINTGAGAVGGTFNTVSSANLTITQSYSPEASNYDIVVLEPYAGYNFYNSDCNVIQNNVDLNTISPLYMDVDFNGGQIVAQNQAAILSGNASRAQIQPWNYSYYSQISGRYVGKQQNAINLNTYTGPTNYTNGSSSIYGYTGSWPGDSASPGVIVPGNIVIQWLDSCIYEMNYGGPGYPENVNGGGISMGNIYLVGETKDDVATITPGTDIYYDILEKTFPSGSPAFQYQYTNTPALPNQLNITYPSLLLPSATYYLASNYEQSSGDLWGTFYPTGSPTFPGTPYILLENVQSNYIPSANININGDLYQDDSLLIRNDSFLNSLDNGSRWFMSFYSGSGNVTSLVGGLPQSCSTTLQQVGFPFEIDQYIDAGGGDNYITFKNAAAIKYWFETGSSYNSYTIGIGAYSNKSYTGILVTKAQYPTNGLTIFGLPNSNFAGAGQGYILSQYPKKVITENLDYILKTYGNKP
jgi:hypothetical protein